MKVRHVALFTWQEGTTPAQVASVTAGLDRLRTVLPNLVRYDYGPDLAIDEGNAVYAVVADFESEADYATYRDHPEHRAFIVEVIRPLVATRTAVQYEIG